MKNFFFRVDSSKKIGSGHLMRCMTLGKYLREQGGNCTFICRNLDGNLNTKITNEGFCLLELERQNGSFVSKGKNEPSHVNWLEVDWITDAMETIQAFSGKK